MELQNWSNIAPTDKVVDEQKYIKLSLSKYQNATIMMCKEMERTYNIMNSRPLTGVIANPVGSGKSFIALALAMSSEGRTLLIVPHNILSQWENYLHSKTKIPYTSIRNKKMLEKNVIGTMYDNLYDIPSMKENTKVILCSSSLHNEVANITPYVERCIVDEPTSIKIPGVLEIVATYIWFMSSSIKDICYPTGYAHGYTGKITEGIHHTGWIKNALQRMSDYEVEEYIIRTHPKHSSYIPDYITQTYSVEESNLFNIIAPIADQRTIELCCADAVEDANERLLNLLKRGTFYPNTLQGLENNIVWHSYNLDNIFSLIYWHTYPKVETKERDLKSMNETVNGLIRNSQAYSENFLNNKLEQLNKKRQKLQHIYQRFRTFVKNLMKSDEICHSCLSYIDGYKCTISCSCKRSREANICVRCVNTSALGSHSKNTVINPKCKKRPPCVSNISALEKTQTWVNTKPTDKKPSYIYELIKEKIDNGRRALVISKTETLLTKTAAILKERLNIEPIYFKGNANQVNALLTRFKNNERQVMFLNAQYYGHGVNLEFVDDLIMCHSMSEDYTTQVIGRAQRPGRKTQLTVSWVVYPNDIDDRYIVDEDEEE